MKTNIAIIISPTILYLIKFLFSSYGPFFQSYGPFDRALFLGKFIFARIWAKRAHNVMDFLKNVVIIFSYK